MADLRIALFVEGSALSPARGIGSIDYRERIWNKHLGRALGLCRFAPILPVTKLHLLAMDPALPPVSGANEGLDAYLGRMLQRQPFDAAVVAWNLQPRWNRESRFCRWEETLLLYRRLGESQSDLLPPIWKEQARRRFAELSRRPRPRARSGPPEIRPGAVLALCLEPTFEGLLTQDESTARRAFGVVEREVPGWPTGWEHGKKRRPDEDLLQEAVLAVSRLRPRPDVLRGVRGDFKTNRDGWGEFLLRRMLAERQGRQQVLAHPLAVRLAELAGAAPPQKTKKPRGRKPVLP